MHCLRCQKSLVCTKTHHTTGFKVLILVNYARHQNLILNKTLLHSCAHVYIVIFQYITMDKMIAGATERVGVRWWQGEA